MNIVLWILQVLLALAFLAHGWLFLWPPPEIAAMMNQSLPRWSLPGITRIKPWLVVWAAGGIMIVMVSATVWHAMRGEISSAVVTLVLLAMATFVAYMRQRVRPIPSRAA